MLWQCQLSTGTTWFGGAEPTMCDVLCVYPSYSPRACFDLFAGVCGHVMQCPLQVLTVVSPSALHRLLSAPFHGHSPVLCSAHTV